VRALALALATALAAGCADVDGECDRLAAKQAMRQVYLDQEEQFRLEVRDSMLRFQIRPQTPESAALHKRVRAHRAVAQRWRLAQQYPDDSAYSLGDRPTDSLEPAVLPPLTEAEQRWYADRCPQSAAGRPARRQAVARAELTPD
jgi:hypothetical protein